MRTSCIMRMTFIVQMSFIMQMTVSALERLIRHKEIEFAANFLLLYSRPIRSMQRNHIIRSL